VELIRNEHPEHFKLLEKENQKSKHVQTNKIDKKVRKEQQSKTKKIKETPGI